MHTDPFAHHPELRDLILDPETSSFRQLSNASVMAQLAEAGLPDDWLYSDPHREALRRDFIGGVAGDIWVFAYGSLMWDPAVRFSQVRRAYLPGHVRRFILRDNQGGRGTPESPGLMAALDVGPPGCDGLAFLIPQERVEAESKILWQREMIGPGYVPVLLPAQTGEAQITCLTFLADHDAPLIAGHLTRAEQVRHIATGHGFLGSSIDYLRNIARHFDAMGIHDPEVTSLLAEAEVYAAF